MTGKTLAGLVTGGLALALAGQSLRWHDRLLASRMLRQVELVSLAAAAAGRAPAGLLPAHLELLQTAARLDPVEVGIPLARGSQFLLFGSPRSAIAPYREAAALEPRPEIYLDLGKALLAAGETAEARRSFALAVRLDPQLAGQVPPEGR